MKEHNKLVRDNILNMIKSEGRTYTYHIADDTEYYEKLKQKLVEEIGEFLESEKFEELSDMLEIIHALCEYKNISFNDLEHERIRKKQARGGFNERIILEKVD